MHSRAKLRVAPGLTQVGHNPDPITALVFLPNAIPLFDIHPSTSFAGQTREEVEQCRADLFRAIHGSEMAARQYDQVRL